MRNIETSEPIVKPFVADGARIYQEFTGDSDDQLGIALVFFRFWMKAFFWPPASGAMRTLGAEVFPPSGIA